jgi:hypothetical protein
MSTATRVRLIVVLSASFAGLSVPAGRAAAALTVSVSSLQSGATVVPGAAKIHVFTINISASSDITGPATLTGVSFTNLTTASGSTQAQRDQDWQTLELWDSRLEPVEKLEFGAPILALQIPDDPVNEPLAVASFSNGVVRFDGFSLSIPAGGSVRLQVLGGASLGARDADVLDLGIPNAQAMSFSNAGLVSGTFPMSPTGAFTVDGMGAAQIGIAAVNKPTIAVGSTRNLALDARIPANGYQADVLQRFAVQNLGTARPGDEIAAVEAWLDDGDGTFKPASDARLGVMGFTGDRWQLSGLTVPLPVGGKRVFVSVDVAELAEAGRTVRLSIPTLPDVGAVVASDNDGPVDVAVSNPSAQTIAVVDRMALASKPIDPGFVSPGQSGVPLLEIVATNTYSVNKRLTGLTVTNSGSGPGTQAQRDGELQVLALRDDADGDGVLEPSDPTLATAVCVGGRATFGGFAWDLAAGKSGQLFVTGDVSLAGASDGDVLAASVTSGADLAFSDATALSASFPLGPGSAWRVNGMVAAQVDRRPAAPVTLSPGAGPALALDVTLPRNGYQDDVLTGLTVVNLGTATTADLAELRLFLDGGDGQLGGDDQDLGALTASGGGWGSGALAVPVGAAGARLFVAVTASASPTDSATIRLAIPLSGATVQSADDGPVDVAVSNPDALLLSNRALQASLAATPAAVTLGQGVTVRMTVRNLAGEAMNGVAPSALTISGTAGFSYASGPAPASATVASGDQQVFTWTYTANGVGSARFTAAASGVGASSGTPQSALPATSGAVQVFQPAAPLPWSPSTSMPLTVNRGQANVAPLVLTFGDGSSASDVRVTALRLRVESGSGAGIIPADLFSRMSVEVGAVTHVERTSLETSGSEVDLTLATPILVPHGGSATAAITFDVDSSTVVPNFRLVIPDSTYLTGQDATSGAPVTLRLQSGSYPVRTGLARVVAEATEIDVAALRSGPLEAARGQHNVPFAALRLANPGVTGLTSDVRVASFVVTLRDSAGRAVAAPSSVLQRLEVWSGPQLLADRPITGSQDSMIDLVLSPLLSVPVNTPLDVRITADLAPTASLGVWRLALADSSTFDASDPNSGHRVLVSYAAPLLQGDSVTVEIPADSILVAGTPRMPPAVGVGAAGVVAIEATLRHPGAARTAAVRLDSLVVRCVDESRNPVAPGPVIERMHVLWNGVEVASLADPPSGGNVMALALPALQIEPGARDTLTLALDFEAAAPTGTFELVLSAAGLFATDADTRLAVAVAPDSGFELPILSGLTRISAPARTLIVDLADRMPAALAADGAEVTAGILTLENSATPGSGSVGVDHMTIRASDATRASTPIGARIAMVRLYRQGALWSESGLAPADTVAALSGASLDVAPQSPIALELRFVPRARAIGGLRLGLLASDVGVIQPTNPLLAIAVQAPAGKAFPQWTELGSFTAASLEASYANFPNPFAAGREPTRFTYWLPAPAEITLVMWTMRGERVTTLLDRVSRGAGLHQGDAWDGRNGRGDVVTNGVYVAEMRVRLASGEGRRLLRKVAVVR